ncbi:ATP-binding protein [Streptomyces aurantiacus]|uniref:ATP-binding protein n=1 Tax=Streptomyces aurantiacus TaxID=47760 RepID=UPI0007C7829B|nr:ATP-binding protein [Streptomyces aurantiacus]
MQAPHTQPPTPARTFAQRFSATRRGARLARLLTAHQLTEWGHPHGTEAHDTVLLVVAELTANSALHGRVPGRDFALFLAYDDERDDGRDADHGHAPALIRIEVTDTHPALPARRKPAPDEDQGRGLLLVDALATRWGVRDRVGPGKTVWAECAVRTTPIGSLDDSNEGFASTSTESTASVG